ncbi:hypothetical protein [Undibacterium sp. Xuan67W]|uniref:hypothetical protein n=1 Tax=Undibacterium sp. Xuan67W TaxID=3413057 RepID=UPI003BF15BEC
MLIKSCISLLFFVSIQSFAAVNVCIDSEGKKTWSDAPCESIGLKYLNPSNPIPANTPTSNSSTSVYQGKPLSWNPKVIMTRRSSVVDQPLNIWGVDVHISSPYSYIGFGVLAVSGLFLLGYLLVYARSRLQAYKRVADKISDG